MSNPKTILVVDDESELREIIKDEFEFRGYRVICAENGKSAFEEIQKEKVDAIVSDIRMPGGSGIELLENLNAAKVSIDSFLFISGFTDLSQIDAYDKGSCGLVPKPFDLAAMAQQVETLLTPLPERWTTTAANFLAQSKLEIMVPSLDQAVSRGLLNLGRGGIFIPTGKALPRIESYVLLKVVDEQKNALIDGYGIVRWTRQNEGDARGRGYGVEFVHLTPQSAKLIFDFLSRSKTLSFIPAATKPG